MKDIVILPLSKDLWVPPTYDAEGNMVPRTDTLDTRNLPRPGVMTQDQMAVMMAQMEAAKNAPKAE